MGKGRKTGRANSIPEGFLERYRRGKGKVVDFITLKAGFLRLEYDPDGSPPLLRRISFTAHRSAHSRAIGNLLELALSPDASGDEATFIAEEGVSGVQWSGGRARWGHTYDDDQPPPEGEAVGLGPWVDRCVGEMINPPREALEEIRRGYDLQSEMGRIRAGDDDAREKLWKRCSPRTGEETGLVLGLLRRAVKEHDGDLLFICCDPLKRATAGSDAILKALTGLLEKGSIATDYDRSEIQEVLEAHARQGNPAIARRWVKICRKVFEDMGPRALHAINAGSLITALVAVPKGGQGAKELFGDIVAAVESAPPGERDGVRGLHSYRTITEFLKRA
jgi:hypothetical protein